MLTSITTAVVFFQYTSCNCMSHLPLFDSERNFHRFIESSAQKKSEYIFEQFLSFAGNLGYWFMCPVSWPKRISLLRIWGTPATRFLTSRTLLQYIFFHLHSVYNPCCTHCRLWRLQDRQYPPHRSPIFLSLTRMGEGVGGGNRP